jgi:microcin C transport system ATP-binding protein
MARAVTTPLLDVRDLSVAFRQAGREMLAVDRVSFAIDKGETLALVGESGSGKSVTALSVLKLLPYPSATHPSGEILFRGENLLDADETDLRRVRGADITMIFQEPMTSLNPLHTIEQQVGEILSIHRGWSSTKIRARVLELLEQVGIVNAKERLDAYPHQLSGGQRQRVMIAMALANEPDLLIADEPTTALDVTVQAQILALLKEMQKRLGMAMLFITHDLGIVRRMADRVCVMQAGRIVEHGPTERVFTAPAHSYTRRLLAAEPKGDPPPVDTAAPIVLEAKDVKVWFPIKRGLFKRTVGHIKAVDGVSVAVRAGETVGIVGESGSGKTTLGLAILRLTRSEGPIVFLGRRIDDLGSREMRPLRKSMQIVFQDPYGSLNPRMRVGNIVAEPLTIHGIGTRAERRERVRELLARVGLDPSAAERYPHAFSGGQRQRIGIARAIACGPRFLVADEPVSALDPPVQAQIVNLMLDLQRQMGLAYLFISHDLRLVRHLSDRVCVLYCGRIVEEAPAAELYREPLHPYTRALLAATPSLTPGTRREPGAVGEPPSPTQWPSGCRFHPRCPVALPACAERTPALLPAGPGRRVACHLVHPPGSATVSAVSGTQIR